MDGAVIIGAGISGLCTGALLASEGVRVTIYERARRVGGRTASTVHRGHILDNGFHIMPFYRASAVYRVLERVGIAKRVGLAPVDDIAFYQDGRFHAYPRGLGGILRLSTVPPAGRLRLLRALLPMAFATVGRTERWDRRPLTDVTCRLDARTGAFFEAVCMLAFADVPARVSLGEFARTMIRANPLRGGTSGFAYPEEGGYDRICERLAEYVAERGGTVRLGAPVGRVLVRDGAARGVAGPGGEEVPADAVVVTYPAYSATRQLFEDGVLGDDVLERAAGLERTTAVVETHFCTSEAADSRQVVFPTGDHTAKGVFFISNITPRVSPPGEHLMMAGTPVPAGDAASPARVREVSARMRAEVAAMYPGFEGSLLWERPMSWGMVESVAKGPGMVWRDKMPHEAGVAGLYFVGDSTVSYGIGTDSAAHSSLLCHPLIMGRLRQGRGGS